MESNLFWTVVFSTKSDTQIMQIMICLLCLSSPVTFYIRCLVLFQNRVVFLLKTKQKENAINVFLFFFVTTAFFLYNCPYTCAVPKMSFFKMMALTFFFSWETTSLLNNGPILYWKNQVLHYYMNSMQTCNSVSRFISCKNSFCDVGRKCN